MGMEFIFMKMVTDFKEIFSRMIKEEEANIFLTKVEFFNHNLILIHHKYLK